MVYPDHKMAQRTPMVDLLTELQLTPFALSTIFLTGSFLSSAPGDKPEDAFILDLTDFLLAVVPGAQHWGFVCMLSFSFLIIFIQLFENSF